VLGWFKRLGGQKAPSNNGQYRYGNTHLIELRNVVKTYETAAGPLTVLKDLDLQIDTGEFVAIIGKSGSGKSTLLNMITGIDRPTSGEVFIGDTVVHKLNEDQTAVWRGRNVGVVFQFFQLLPTLTVVENIMLPMDFSDLYSNRERYERAMQLLARVDLADQADKLPTALSGGQQQRVAIARALANDPPLIVADEPTGNLDSQTSEAVFRLFEKLAEQGKTILMVTHDADLAKRVNRTVVIADGEIIDEYLAQVFPALTEAQLKDATHNLERIKIEPGAVILREGGAPDKFYLVTKGRIEVVLQDPTGRELRVSQMGPGQYFGEIELLRGGKHVATVRAAPDTEVEVATLDKATFDRLLAESAPTKAQFARVAQERLEENRASRRAAPEG
jgi:ABC-type lipoprotein export system ATPase subunit